MRKTKTVQLSAEGCFTDSINFVNKQTETASFFEELYQHLHLNYPKFFKMDNLCKTALLATETLISSPIVNPYQTAIILQCKHSSLDTDLKFQKSLGDFASPSLFVYTLPNVMIGELCIKFNIKGENTCFVVEEFDLPFLEKYAQLLLVQNKAEKVICGVVDYFQSDFFANISIFEN